MHRLTNARFCLDGNCAKALCEPDGSPCFGSTDVGTLSNPCHWKSTSSRRLSFISDDCKHCQRVCVQAQKGYDNGRSQKSMVPYAPGGLTFFHLISVGSPHGRSIIACSGVQTALTRYFGGPIAALAAALL
jgi:hypothetical protein